MTTVNVLQLEDSPRDYQLRSVYMERLIRLFIDSLAQVIIFSLFLIYFITVIVMLLSTGSKGLFFILILLLTTSILTLLRYYFSVEE